MLSAKTRERIRKHKWTEHSNQSLFFKRIKDQAVLALKDLNLLARELKEDQLKEIFYPSNSEDLKKGRMSPIIDLINSVLEPSNHRTVVLTEMISDRVFQKLIRELPLDMVNELSGDIGKTWTYAKLLSQHFDKPLGRE